MVLGSYYGLTPRGDVTELKDYFYYVPLLSSLQALLNNEDISKQVGILGKLTIAINNLGNIHDRIMMVMS